MTPAQIQSLGPQLATFLGEFRDCFGRSEPRQHLANYIRGQLSNLPRKSVEPIADFTNTPRRTLQEFLDWSTWDHIGLRERLQQIVARDHADEQAIGILDDSGHPKSGDKTACVQRQWCGNTGKIDNCVVSVHLCYASYDTRFRVMLDSDLFLPEHTWADPQRRLEADIPKAVVYRPKYQIALDQIRRAQANGIHFGWFTADEWYASASDFLAGLEELHLRYVVEIRRNFHGWFCDPRSETRSVYRDIETLCRYSGAMLRQPWQRVYLKDTDKGPVVWEVKRTPFWIRRNGQILGPYWLIYACNVLNPGEEKYFLSNAASGTPLEAILHVAFGRWPMERCLEDEKDELGMSHFEVRKYGAIMRHLSVTQVSHLFVARQTVRLREKKSRDHTVPSPHSGQRSDRRSEPSSEGSPRASEPNLPQAARRSKEERASASVPHANPLNQTGRVRD
jgi:SRSO17 transposase